MEKQMVDFLVKVKKELKKFKPDQEFEPSDFLQLVFESYAITINGLLQAYALNRKNFKILEAEKIKDCLCELGIDVGLFMDDQPLIEA